MKQHADLVAKYFLTLLSLAEQVVSQEAFQDCSNVSDVILQSSRVDQDVIDLHDHPSSEHVPEHPINKCLEH